VIRRAEALATRYPTAAPILRHFIDTAKSNKYNSLPVVEKTNSPLCPHCGNKPQASVLRPSGDGARRSLVCGHCTQEWTFPRIECPGCGERTFENLPVYIAEDYPHLRVECCTSCHHYLIASDLVKDPEAIPLVDDLAAVALHLWAEEHGYTKIDRDWFGMDP
jgi:FdhE protein